MPIDLIVDSLENVSENVKPLYIAENGKFRLDVRGAVPEAEANGLKAENENLKAIAYGSDGKSYKDMFEGSQTALKAARNERNSFENEVKGFKAIGTLDEVQRIKDELDGYKAKGEKLEDVQRQLADIKQANREYLDKNTKLSTQISELTESNKELAQYKSDSEKRIALMDAENQIASVVENLKEANQKALRRQLIDRYRSGDLVKGPNGKLFAQAENQSLEVYAKEMMEDYNLIIGNKSGISAPPPNPAANGGSKQTTTTYASLASMLH